MTAAAANPLLMIFSRAPSSTLTRDILDASLAAAAFELPTTLLFIDDGVYSLLPDQQPSSQCAGTPLSDTLGALAIYGIDHVFVSQEALQKRGMTELNPCICAKIATREDITSLIHTHSRIITI